MLKTEVSSLYTYQLDEIINSDPMLEIRFNEETNVSTLADIQKTYFATGVVFMSADESPRLFLGKASQIIRFLTKAVLCCDINDLNDVISWILKDAAKAKCSIERIQPIPTQTWKLLTEREKRYTLRNGYVDAKVSQYEIADSPGSIAVIDYELNVQNHKLNLMFDKCERKLFSPVVRLTGISSLTAGFVYLDSDTSYSICKSSDIDIQEDTHFDALVGYYVSNRVAGSILTDSNFSIFAHIPYNTKSLHDILKALNLATNRLAEVL